MHFENYYPSRENILSGEVAWILSMIEEKERNDN
jgi:hypothetical protein